MKNTRRRSKSSIANLLPNFVKPQDEFEVWVLGTWQHETGHARVEFIGSQTECIDFRATSDVRSTLSIRPTGRTLQA